MAIKNIATLGIKVDPKGAVSGASRAKKAIRGIGNVAGKVKNQIFSLNGAMGALGAGMVAKSALNYVSSIEDLHVKLKFLTGSTKKASKAFEQMMKVAKSAPVSLQEIQQASPALLTVAEDVDELASLLEMTGDIAQVSGLSFVDTALQMQRAFSSGIASAEMFREKAVGAMLGFEAGVSKTGAETKKIFDDLWKHNKTTMVGAMKEGAKTFTGQTSMMGDAWDELQLSFMKAGVFDEVKETVKELTEYLKDPETIASVKELGKQTVEISKAIRSSIKDFHELPDWVKTAGIVGAVFGGKAGKVILAGLLYAGKELGELIDKFTDAPDPVQIPDLIEPKSKPVLSVDVADIAEKRTRQYTKMSDVIDKFQSSVNKATTALTKKDKLALQYKETLKELEDLYGSSIVSQEKQIRLTEMATNVYEEGIQAIKDAEIDKKVQALTDSMTTSITDMIMNIGQGTQSLKESVKDMARVVLAEFVKIKVAQPMAEALAGGFGGFNFSSIFRAQGGTVTGNKPYIVGEQGAEVFLPNKTGTIIPNDALGMGSQSGGETNVNVSFNITANDTDGFDELLESRRGMIVNLINGAMNDRGTLGVV